MSSTADKIRKLTKQAASDKIAEQQKKIETNVNQDIEVIEKILAMVKDRLVYKETKTPYSNKKNYVVVTEDTVLEDYSNAPEYRSGTAIKEIADGYYNYRHTTITVNGHTYYHASDLIAKYKYESRVAMEKLDIELDAARKRKEAIDNMDDLEPLIKELMLNYQKHLGNASATNHE